MISSQIRDYLRADNWINGREGAEPSAAELGLSTTDLLAALTLLVLDIIFMPWSSRAVSNLDYISHFSLELWSST